MFYKKIAVGIAILFLSACTSSNEIPTTEITVDMNEFLYAPASITIPANQPVVLTLQNSGTQEHDFVIEKIAVKDVSIEGSTAGAHHMHGSDMPTYALHVSTAVGGTSVLSFTATESGTYKIFCSVEGHEIAGMSGKLIVVSQ